MEQVVAFCGLNCGQCPAFVATRTNDAEALSRLAKEWGGDYPPEVATADAVRCSGCLQGSGPYLAFFCGDCAIRSCAIERELASCAYCADLDGCEKLKPCWEMSPEAKATIQSLRESRA